MKILSTTFISLCLFAFAPYIVRRVRRELTFHQLHQSSAQRPSTSREAAHENPLTRQLGALQARRASNRFSTRTILHAQLAGGSPSSPAREVSDEQYRK